MKLYRRVPVPTLNRYVAWLWYYVDFYPDHSRELVLPDGTLELIINLEDRPRKLFDRHDPSRYQAFRRGWISGAQKEHLVIDALPGSTMIGAHFLPGKASAFLGVPCCEVTNSVVELEDLWGSRVHEWRERLLAAKGPQAKFRILEDLLLERLKAAQKHVSPTAAVSSALELFVREPHLQNIASASERLGMSHKHFITQFRREVGLSPKLFCRIQRFQQVLGQIHSHRSVLWADVVHSCGYFDQSHFIKDFVAFAGINPSAYLVQQIVGDSKFVRAPLR